MAAKQLFICQTLQRPWAPTSTYTSNEQTKKPQTIPIALHGGQPFTLGKKKQANKLLRVSILLDKQEVTCISRLFKAIGFPSQELYPMTTSITLWLCKQRFLPKVDREAKGLPFQQKAGFLIKALLPLNQFTQTDSCKEQLLADC